MDPNATLRQIRRIVDRMADADATPKDPETAAYVNDADALVTLVASLDDWIAKGGFLPAEWSEGRK